MLGTGYFLKIAKINSPQEKPICSNRKNKFPQNTKNRQSAKINCYSRKNFLPHGIPLRNVANRLHEKPKVGLPKTVTRLPDAHVGSPAYSFSRSIASPL